MNEPKTLTIGDRVEWTESLSDFPAATWTLTYYFVGPETFSKVAVADGDDHDVVFTDVQSAALEPGDYQWWARVDDGSNDVRTIDNGRITIAPDPSKLKEGLDPRTYAERMCEALEATLEGRAEVDHKSYTVEGRSLERLTFEELTSALDLWRSRVANERRARDFANGKTGSRTVGVRF